MATPPEPDEEGSYEFRDYFDPNPPSPWEQERFLIRVHFYSNKVGGEPYLHGGKITWGVYLKGWCMWLGVWPSPKGFSN